MSVNNTPPVSRSTSVARAKRPIALDLDVQLPALIVSEENEQTPQTATTLIVRQLRERIEERSRSRSPGFSSPSQSMRTFNDSDRDFAGSKDFAPRSAGGESSPAFSPHRARHHRRDFSGEFSSPYRRAESSHSRMLSLDRTMMLDAGARAPSPRKVPFPAEWLETGLDDLVVKSMQESFEKTMEGLRRENKLLRFRSGVDEAALQEEKNEVEDKEKEVQELLNQGLERFDWERIERRERTRDARVELDEMLDRTEAAMWRDPDWGGLQAVEAHICRARLARALGEGKQVEIHANAANEKVHRLNNPKLKARCMYWTGIALYQQEQWNEALEAFRTSRGAIGTYLSDEEIELAIDAAERSYANGKPFVTYQEIGIRSAWHIEADKSQSLAEEQLKRIERQLRQIAAKDDRWIQSKPSGAPFEVTSSDIKAPQSLSPTSPPPLREPCADDSQPTSHGLTSPALGGPLTPITIRDDPPNFDRPFSRSSVKSMGSRSVEERGRSRTLSRASTASMFSNASLASQDSAISTVTTNSGPRRGDGTGPSMSEELLGIDEGNSEVD